MKSRHIRDLVDLLGYVVVDPGSGCYIWIGGNSGEPGQGRGWGYGRVWYRGAMWATHRLAFKLAGGKLRPGQTLDHNRKMGCCHRGCIRPEHLEAVSHKENCRRRDRNLKRMK